MKLLFRTPKTRQPVTLEVSPDAKLEDVRNELQSKHNFEQGDYKFVCDKRTLQNPTPFSSLKENSTIIVLLDHSLLLHNRHQPSQYNQIYKNNSQNHPKKPFKSFLQFLIQPFLST